LLQYLAPACSDFVLADTVQNVFRIIFPSEFSVGFDCVAIPENTLENGFSKQACEQGCSASANKKGVGTHPKYSHYKAASKLF